MVSSDVMDEAQKGRGEVSTTGQYRVLSKHCERKPHRGPASISGESAAYLLRLSWLARTSKLHSPSKARS